MVREGFQIEVETIDAQVGEMATLARGMLRDGLQSLLDLDREAANVVVSRADELAQLDEDIETNVLSLLALQAPVAGDLRRMGAALKLITYLNRIGRYGYDIARMTQGWTEGLDHVARPVYLKEMASKVEAMLDLVLAAFRDHAAPDASPLVELEDDVDALRYSVWRECLTYMAQDTRHIEPSAHYMMVARYLERCGDNVCKMAEKLHYVATGERLLLP